MRAEAAKVFQTLKDILPKTKRDKITVGAMLAGAVLGTAVPYAANAMGDAIDARFFKEGRERVAAAKAQAEQDAFNIKVRNFQESRGVNLTYGEGNVIRVELNDSLSVAPPGYDPLLAAADRIRAETHKEVSALSHVPENRWANPPVKGGIYISTLPN